MQSQSLHPRSHRAALTNNNTSYTTPFHGSSVRSVHFAPSVDMPLRAGGQSSILGRSRSRNAPYAPPSTAPSARSWVYPYNQHQPTPLPPSPTDRPDPLPGPFHKQKGLHVVNAILGDDDELDDTDNTQSNSLGIDFGHHQTELSPPTSSKNKKSIIGRVFRGVGLFGKESGGKLKRRPTASFDTVPTLATYGDSSSSNAGDMPGPSTTFGLGLHVPHNVPTPIIEVPETEDQHGTPLPEVFRLSDNIPPLQSRARPPPPPTTTSNNTRPKSVSRKPVNAGASSRFVEPATATESVADHNYNVNSNNVDDRATVMIYEQNLSRAPTGAQTPLAISRHPSSTHASVQPEPATGPGYSSFQPLRPTSFAPTHQTHGSIRDPVSVAPTRRTSIASPLAPRSRQVSLSRGVIGLAPSASSIPDFPPGPYPPHPTSRATSIVHQVSPPPLPLQTTTVTTNPDVTSPISAHPLPTEDYLKMTLSPPSTKHTITTSNTTFSSNPSFSSDLSPFARFVKALYKMPWISHDRVTVDYLPDHGLLGANVKAKKGKVKRMATWYRSMLASRRNSDNADLLGRGGKRRRRHRDLDVSLGAALAELGSFTATKRRKGRTTERSRKHHHHHHRNHRHHHHHHSSSRHHHRHGRRTTATTMTDDSTFDSTLQTTTPLAPPMYPYFPPYPMPFQTPFVQADVGSPTTAGGGVPPTPAAYQTLFSPAPFYVFQPPAIPPVPTVDKQGVGDPITSTTSGSVVPPALVPGAVDREHVPGGFS